MFVALLPASIGIAVWIPAVSSVWNYVGTFFVALPLTAVLAQIGRQAGKQSEAELFQSWGGTPTTRLLSHRFSSFNKLTLGRYHKKLCSLLPDLRIPEPSDEIKNPGAANQVYDSCVHFLREKTRDRKQFPLVFAENANYGFRRNLWAVKLYGIESSVIGIICCVVFLRYGVTGESKSLSVVGLLISVAFLVLWLTVFKPTWVRAAAYSYAERLLGVLDIL